MASPRPTIFISAATADLGSCRQLVKDALLTLGCVPGEQTTFAPDTRAVRETLRAKIGVCDAVVHIVGRCFGSEPRHRDPGESRRSYTQLEFDMARELDTPVYVFVCAEAFPYDDHEPEDPEREERQREHRTRLTGGDDKYERVATREELSARVHALQDRVEQLAENLRRARAWLGRGVIVVLAALVPLGGAQWWLTHRTQETQTRLAKVESSLDRQRRYLSTVTRVYMEQKAQLTELKLTNTELSERARAVVARREGITVAELGSAINEFVVATRLDPSADNLDQALAAAAQLRFADAARHAGRAADNAGRQRLAAGASGRRESDRERRARTLQGEYLFADAQYEDAVAAYALALAQTPQGARPVAWARTLYGLSTALRFQAMAAFGKERARLLGESIAGIRSILQVIRREDVPLFWAGAQHGLAIALRASAGSANLAERRRLLGESIAAFRRAFDVLTRKEYPHRWAVVQHNLALAFRDQATVSEAGDKRSILGDSVAALRQVLDVQTRENTPHEWARTQDNLGVTLARQAEVASENERVHLLNAALVAYHRALQVRTRETSPRDWGMTQFNLASAFEALAETGSGAERARLLGEAVDASRRALEGCEREHLPRPWAALQYSLGARLVSLAKVKEGSERARLLGDGIQAYRLALGVFSPKASPQGWAMVQNDLAVALREQAKVCEPKNRSALLREAVVAMRAVLRVWTARTAPERHVSRVKWIAATEEQIRMAGSR